MTRPWGADIVLDPRLVCPAHDAATRTLDPGLARPDRAVVSRGRRGSGGERP